MPQHDLFETDFFLGELPEGTYRDFIRRKLGPTRQKHFSSLFTEMQREYNTSLAGFARANRGVSPTSRPELTTFSNFLENFPFEDKFYETPAWERNPDFQAFNPRTRFLF